MNLIQKIKTMKLKLIVFLLLTACGSLSEAGKALRNEKVNSTDEFLIEKRGPLTLPPNMNELPMPSSQNSNKSKKSVQNEILNNNDQNITSEKQTKTNLEKIILQEIKKN